MSTPPPGWRPDTNFSPTPRSPEAPADPTSGAAQFTAYDAAASVPLAPSGPMSAALGSSVPTPAAPSVSPAQRTLTQRNSTTFTAIVVVALYLVLAATTGIVLIGIFPAMLAVRALQRREPLAGLAIAAAAVAIAFSITVLTAH